MQKSLILRDSFGKTKCPQNMPKDPERQRLPRKAKGKDIKKQPKRGGEDQRPFEQF